MHCDPYQGRLHKGGMVRDAPWRKLGGGDVVMIMMLLLESIIIYYYMHEYTYHFTPVHF